MLLYIDKYRGDDATGVFSVDNLGNVEMAKEASEAADFIRTKEYDKVKDLAFRRGFALVGHNRKATRGAAKEDRNAHPFVVDDKLVLVHNGSFYGDHKKIADTEVDSEAIAKLIAREPNTEEALKQVNAAYALIWYDVDNKKLNFIRNKQRPLWWVQTDREYIFASERAFLKLVIDRFALKVVEGPAELKEFNLTTFQLDKGRIGSVENTELKCDYVHPVGQIITPPFRGIACGWGDSDSCEVSDWGDLDRWTRRRWAAGRSSEEVFPLPPKSTALALPIPIRRPARLAIADISDKVYEEVKHDFTAVTYADFMRIKDAYPPGLKVKVIINDLVEADNDPKTKNFFMIGRLLGNQHVYVTFPFTDHPLEQAMLNADNAVYEMVVEAPSWKRHSPTTAEESRRINMDNWKGMCMLLGKDASPVIVNGGNNATH